MQYERKENIQMKRIAKKLIVRYGKQLYKLAVGAGKTAQAACKLFFYEPKQPEGLDEFLAGK